MTNMDAELDLENETIEDYTLMIRNIPRTRSSLNDLVELIQLEDMKPVKFFYTYKMSDFVKLKNDLLKYKRMYCECQMKDVFLF